MSLGLVFDYPKVKWAWMRQYYAYLFDAIKKHNGLQLKYYLGCSVTLISVYCSVLHIVTCISECRRGLDW
jgi:hypothetical protein